jgi:hypothetical protein
MQRHLTSTILAVSALLAWTVVPAAAADSVTGEVVDLACYLVHPQSSTGAGHKKCAEVCLKKGMPAGLLTADKQLYLLLEDHDNQKPYATVRDKAAQTVTVEGEKVTQNGMQGIVVEAVK